MVSVIAKNLNNRRRHKALCEIFDKADTSNDGTISLQEYISICNEYGYEVDDDDLEDIKLLCDAEGEVHKNDFIMHLKKHSKAFEKADPDSDLHWVTKINLAWKLFDKNQDGYVNKKEFRWMVHSDVIRNKHIDICFRRCDLNGDGKLDYNEFKTMIWRNKERKEMVQEEKEIEELEKQKERKDKQEKQEKKALKKKDKKKEKNDKKGKKKKGKK